MPNLKIFNLEPNQLKTQIFGSNTATALNTDAEGKLQIRSISDVVQMTSAEALTVQANNLDIRQLSNVSDSILMYGFDGTNNQALETDVEGKLQIRSISDIVEITSGEALTVQATDLDIRGLSNVSDSILMYGFDGAANQPVGTTSAGLVKMQRAGREFDEAFSQNVDAVGTFTGLLSQDTSELSEYSFAVHNKSSNTVGVRVEISPDQSTWYIDTSEQTVDANTIDVFVAAKFLRYTRVAYRSVAGSTIDVWFQARV